MSNFGKSKFQFFFHFLKTHFIFNISHFLLSFYSIKLELKNLNTEGTMTTKSLKQKIEKWTKEDLMHLQSILLTFYSIKFLILLINI
jgi:hypothetical protein